MIGRKKLVPSQRLANLTLGISFAGASLFGPGAFAQSGDSKLEKALAIPPRQPGVDVEQVPPSEIESCRLDEGKRDGIAGFFVSGPAGQPLRWFADTNGDNKLDRWSFYNAGVEVYRETDTDANRKADEYRWLSTAGMRRGIDEDEDGKIDRWAAISAEEVTAEVIGATAERDPSRFERLLITLDELESLGLGQAKLEKLSQRVRDARTQFEDWSAGQSIVTRNSKWTNFGADKPGVVPAGTEGSEQDVVVYENVVALFEDQEEAKQLLVGTMVQVGNRWRLVDLPRAVTDGAVLNEEGMFFTATFSSRNTGSSATAPGVSSVLVRLVGELQEVDTQLLSGTPGDMERLHDERASILEKLVAETKEPDERSNWIRQLADTVNAAAQAGEYKGGVDRLESFARRLGSSGAAESDIAYVVYRSLEARHQQASAEAKEDQWEEVQDAHVKRLAKFANEYPESAEAADAMINIALSAELAGDVAEASKWYRQAATVLGESLPGQKAAGALRRLNLEGKAFTFTGNRVDGGRFQAGAYRGGPVIYHCWANWSTQSKSEMAVLKQIAAKYAKDGVRVVGINFDVSATDQQARDAFLRSGGYTWPQIAETKGLDGPFAVNYGVLSLPLNIVVGKDGRVEKVGLFSLEIDSLLEEMLDK